MIPLKISTEQMIVLHGFFAEAVAVGEEALGEMTGCETEIEVQEIRATALCLRPTPALPARPRSA